MNTLKISVLLILIQFSGVTIFAQTDSVNHSIDSVQRAVMQELTSKLDEIEQQRIDDSIQKAKLESRLEMLSTSDNLEKEDLLSQLKEIEDKEKIRIAEKKARIDLMRTTSQGFPVMGVLDDTLFFVNAKIGASTPKERAERITQKIAGLYADEFLKTDSILVLKSDLTYDIVYREIIIMSISENDALWYDKTMPDLANELKTKITDSIITARKREQPIKITCKNRACNSCSGFGQVIYLAHWKRVQKVIKFY